MAPVINDDGSRRMTIVAHDDGRFSFEEERRTVDHVPQLGPLIYWSCTHQSGLYASRADAERDANATLPWLQGLSAE